MTDAPERIAEFVDRHLRKRGQDPDIIHSYDVTPTSGAYLTVTDLRDVLSRIAALEAEVARMRDVRDNLQSLCREYEARLNAAFHANA